MKKIYDAVAVQMTSVTSPVPMNKDHVYNQAMFPKAKDGDIDTYWAMPMHRNYTSLDMSYLEGRYVAQILGTDLLLVGLDCDTFLFRNQPNLLSHVCHGTSDDTEIVENITTTLSDCVLLLSDAKLPTEDEGWSRPLIGLVEMTTYVLGGNPLREPISIEVSTPSSEEMIRSITTPHPSALYPPFVTKGNN